MIYKNMLAVHPFGNPNHHPLIFLHGLFGSTEDFHPIIEKLRHKFYCLGIDLPGHGYSSITFPVTFITVLAQLIAIIAPLKTPAIVGYSLGGRLAMLLNYHCNLSHTIILSAHPGLSYRQKKENAVKESHWKSLLDSLSLKEFMALWYNQEVFQGLDLTSILQRRCNINQAAASHIMQALALSKQPSLWQLLKTPSSPFLFLSGAADVKYTSLYQHLPCTCQKITLAETSHALHLQAPSLCAEIIATFFINTARQKKPFHAYNLPLARSWHHAQDRMEKLFSI